MNYYKATQLVQRLQEPTGALGLLASLTPSFKPSIRESLSSTFMLDCMAAAEFEGTLIPKVIDSLIANKAQLRAESVELSLKPNLTEWKLLGDDLERYKTWSVLDPSKVKDMQISVEELQAVYDKRKDIGPISIYVIAPQNLMEYAKAFIQAESQRPSWQLHEPTEMRQSLMERHRAQKYVGWIELDNGFMYFKNWSMFDRVAKLDLFQIKHSLSPPTIQLTVPQRTDYLASRKDMQDSPQI